MALATPVSKADVALATHSLAGGGAERAMVLLANELSARGYAVDLVTWNSEGISAGSYRHLVSPAVRQETLSPSNRPWVLAWRLGRHLRAAGYPPLLTTLPTANLAGLSLKAVWGRRLRVVVRVAGHMTSVLDNPGSGRWFRGWLLGHNHLLRFADAVVCLNEEMAVDLKGHAPGAASRMVVIPNPAPVSEILARAALPPHPAFAELADGGQDGRSAPVIVSAGRLAPQKDQATLLRAFARLGPGLDGVMPSLLLLGEGPERGRLEGLGRELGVSGRLRMPGFVDNPYACMGRARVVAQTSVYEGDSHVPVEALSCGTRVLLTGFPGARELLRGRDCFGEVVGVGDVAGLAAGLRRALEGPALSGASREALIEAMRMERDVGWAVDRYAAALGLPSPPSGRGQ